MQLISEVMTAGLLEKVAGSEDAQPTCQHRQVARAVMTVGGHGQPLNRAERRAQAAIDRRNAKRGKVSA